MDLKTTSARPIRNKRLNRRSWSSLGLGHGMNRITKKLFTPEIKRQLKKWLVDRQENPYPTRAEKKQLADSTGLTYIQICNWFANWRRKLKNTGTEEEEELQPHYQQRNWKRLIRTYNDHAKGNVEQLPVDDDDQEDFFSQCSSEEEPFETGRRESLDNFLPSTDMNNNNWRTSGDSAKEETETQRSPEGARLPRGKYKRFIMQKYFQDEQSNGETHLHTSEDDGNRPQLLKWIESTAKFTPGKLNYSAWQMNKMSQLRNLTTAQTNLSPVGPNNVENVDSHRFKEIEAAEALTRLACI